MKPNYRIQDKLHLLAYCIIFVGLFFYFLSLRRGQGFYIDDVAYLMESTRFLKADWKLWWWFPQCINSFYIDIPYIWYPIALFRAALGKYLLHTVNGIDLFASLRATFATILLFIFAKKTILPKSNSLIILLAGLSFLFIGTTPLYLAMARPETSIFIIVLLSILCALSPSKDSKYDDKAKAITQILLLLWGISAHAQVLVFIPIFLLGILFRQHLTKQRKLFFAFLLFLVPAFSFPTLSVQTSCPHDKRISTFLDAWSITPSDFKNPSKLIFELKRNLFFLLTSSHATEFFDDLDGASHARRPLSSLFLKTINFLISTSELLLYTSITILFITTCYELLLSSRNNNFYNQHVLGITLYICFVIWGALRGKMSYLAPILHGFPVITLFLLWNTNSSHTLAAKIKEKLPKTLFYAYLFCFPPALFCNLYLYAGFSKVSNSPVLENPDKLTFYRIKELVYPDMLSDFLKQCKFEKVPQETPILISSSTYFFLQDRSPLIHAHLGHSPDKGSAHIYTGGFKRIPFLLPCKKFKPFQNNITHQQGEFCCGIFQPR